MLPAMAEPDPSPTAMRDWGLAGPGVAGRRLDFVLPVLALLMCGWLLVHTGWVSLTTAAALALVGLVVGRVRPVPA